VENDFVARFTKGAPCAWYYGCDLMVSSKTDGQVTVREQVGILAKIAYLLSLTDCRVMG
jgi:hypothetical protein